MKTISNAFVAKEQQNNNVLAIKQAARPLSLVRKEPILMRKEQEACNRATD